MIELYKSFKIPYFCSGNLSVSTLSGVKTWRKMYPMFLFFSQESLTFLKENPEMAVFVENFILDTFDIRLR